MDIKVIAEQLQRQIGNYDTNRFYGLAASLTECHNLGRFRLETVCREGER